MKAPGSADAAEAPAGEGGAKGEPPSANRSSALLDCEAAASRLTPGQAKELGKDKGESPSLPSRPTHNNLERE